MCDGCRHGHEFVDRVTKLSRAFKFFRKMAIINFLEIVKVAARWDTPKDAIMDARHCTSE